MNILGIETSCDETALAIVTDCKKILGHQMLSQWSEHREFGGIVPEIAARTHLQHIHNLLDQVLEESHCALCDLDGIAATCGPGLAGGLLVGSLVGRTLSMIVKKPFFAVNHLQAHALTVRFERDVSFPYLLLLVSGGHTQTLYVKGVNCYDLIGTTRDDSVGEVFDKVARMLGASVPNGKYIEELAHQGDPYKYDFPVPMKGHAGYDFSFSGLKAAVRREIEGKRLTETHKRDLAASFQKVAIEALIGRFSKSFEHWKFDTFVVSGGVACNMLLRRELQNLALQKGVQCLYPRLDLCSDNGVMVAWCGVEMYQCGYVSSLDQKIRPRWPLNELS